MICPACEHINPDENNFCGRCGGNLRASDGNNGSQSLIAETLQHSPGRSGTPHNVELSPELVEFDKQIPLIATPGTDRRQNIPEHLREELRAAIDKMEHGNRNEEHQAVRAGDPAAADALNHAYGSFEPRPATIAPNPALDIPPSPAATKSNYLDMSPTDVNSSMRLSGPSFLGLGDTSAEFAEDEPERSHTRRNLALLTLLILCGLGAAQWKSLRDFGLEYIHNGTVSLSTLKKQVPAAKPPAATPDTSIQTPTGAASANSNSKPNIEVAPVNSDQKAAQNQTQPSPTNATQTDGSPLVNNENVALPPSTPSAMSALAGTKNSLTPGIAKEEPAEKPVTISKTAERRKEEPPTTEPQLGNAELRQADAAASPEIQASLLWKAIKLGNPEAPVRLAEMYIAGRGVPQNCEQAIILLRSAATHKNARARGKMGALYATGQCVPKDVVQAYRWMSMALEANPNSEWTLKYRQSLWAQMTQDQKLRVARR